MNKQSLYIENFKTLYPETVKYFDDSLFEPFIGKSTNKDILLYYHPSLPNTTVTFPIAYSTGGVQRGAIEDEGLPEFYYTQIVDHNELNYCVNIAMRNLKDCIDTNKYKFVYINDKVLPIDEFIKQYGYYAMKVNQDTQMIYGNTYQEDSYSHSPFYKSQGEYAHIVGITGNSLIPIITPYIREYKVTSGNVAVGEFLATFSAPLHQFRFSVNPDMSAMLGADGNDSLEISEKGSYIKVDDVMYGINNSLYVEPGLTEKERLFILSPTEDLTNTEENVMGMLYSKGGIEQYLEAFDICYKWMYPIDYLFVNGRKVRHKSEINQPAIKAFKKVRHIL